MPAIILENGKWKVFARGQQWEFGTQFEAQKKANEETWKEAEEKGLGPTHAKS